MGLQRFLPFLLRRPPGLPEERVLLGRSGIARALPTPASLAVLSPEGRPRTAAALGAPVGGGSMLSQAIDAMLNRLSEFLPPPGTPPPTISLVSAEERHVGLGQWRGLDLRDGFPIALKGVRVAATVRLQVWDSQPTAVESAVSTFAEQVLTQKDALFEEGFLDIRLKATAVSEQVPSVNAWRQTADFEVLYEFHFQDSDGAGGLIATIPVELREALGTALVTGDVAVWNETGAPPLRLDGPRAVAGLGSLAFLPGAAPAGTVTMLRTFQGASGAPQVSPTLDDFLSKVAGPAPATRHAQVDFPALGDFLAALGAEGDPLEFVDELGAPRAFGSRSRTFEQAVELSSWNHRLQVSFSGASLGAHQIVYLRAVRGTTNPA